MVKIVGKKSVLDGIKLDGSHDVFRELYVRQKQAVWFPEEINIQQDVMDYESLNDDELRLFHDLIGYFVTSELLVQNVLWEAFYPYIAHPHAKMAMTVQMFMEDIHSDFFETILNTFNMDRTQMYNKTTTDPLLKKKQGLVAQAADAISVGAGNVIDPDTLKWQQKILYAILVNNILQEGIFFYSAFTLYFAMRETGKMKNVNNGVDLVLIDESFHLQLGIELILAMLEENPKLAEDENFVEMVRKTLTDGVDIELEFLKRHFANHVVFGVSYEEMEWYLKYITDRRLEELGFEPYYGVEKNPIKWLEKQDLMVLQNFFETTPNQYTNF